MAQVAEGALGKVSDIFQRMRELAVQAANGTNSDADRTSLNEEFVQLAQEATRTLGGTQFNGQNILATTNTHLPDRRQQRHDDQPDHGQPFTGRLPPASPPCWARPSCPGSVPTLQISGTDGSTARLARH
jgi:flagellin-like hook-associated protein FlgL